MNTIKRYNGILLPVSTVRETVIVLSKQPGRYTVKDIQTAINNQLTNERISLVIVRRALATILEEQSKLVRK